MSKNEFRVRGWKTPLGESLPGWYPHIMNTYDPYKDTGGLIIGP